MRSADAQQGERDAFLSVQTRGICFTLVCVGLAMVAARIAVVRSSTGEVPFLGANDRSRWATVSALVDDGTYAIDRQLQIRDSRTGRRTWQTIDLVRHRGPDGRQHYYSSKPPLLPTMIAGVYAAVRGLTGLTLEQRPFFVGRLVLALVNLPMLAVLYGCVVSVILRHRIRPWGAIFLTAGTVFGTLVTPFAITLNNHLPAATATAVALWCFVRLHKRGQTPSREATLERGGEGKRGQTPFLEPSQERGSAAFPLGHKRGQTPSSEPCHEGGNEGKRGQTPSIESTLERGGEGKRGQTPLLEPSQERGRAAFLLGWLKRALTPFVETGLPAAGWGGMFLAGVAAGFAVANELPALSMAAVWSVLALRRDWVRALTAFAPGALLVAIAFFGTNWLAHQTWRPAYAHRTVGAEVARFAADTDEPQAADVRRALIESAERPITQRAGAERAADLRASLAGPLTIERSRTAGRWRAHFVESDRLWAIEREEGTGGEGAGRFVVREWDDWYDYPGSYWTAEKLRGVDRGEPSRAAYAFHMLVGHHGVFSLTPLWLLSLGGSLVWLSRGGRSRREIAAIGELGQTGEAKQDPLFWRLLAAAIVAVTLVCMAFYVARPLIDRNYGGVSVAFRWLLWLVPLWIWLAIPVVDVMQRSRWGRGFCVALIVGSVFSVFTALENPWSHPWIYRYMDYLGWIAD